MRRHLPRMSIKLSRPQTIALKAVMLFRFVFICAGRRGGKTFLVRVLLMIASQRPNQNVWYIAPTYRMAKRLMWETLKQAVPVSLRSAKNETELTITLINGSKISLFGADNPDGLVGDGIDCCIIDEAALIKSLHAVYDRSIRPALADRQGKLIMTSTPRGFNYFWELCCDCFNFPAHFPVKPDRKISNKSYFIGYTTAEGGQVPEEELADARSRMDARLYRQEFDASFEKPGDLVYENFSIANIDEVEIDPSKDLHIGMDFNVNPMSACVGQIDGERLALSDEITITNGNTEIMCQEIKRRYPNHRITVYPDPSGKARKTSAPVGVTDFSIIQSYGFGLVAPKAAPLVVDRVNAVNAMLCSADDKRRIIVGSHCRTIIAGMQSQQFKEGTRIPDKGQGFDHMNDCVGYLVWMRFNLIVGSAPHQDRGEVWA
jgi:hypothetical protein